MPYIIEFLKNSTTGEWARSTNAATGGEFTSYPEAGQALEKNSHFRAKTFSFRIRGKEVAMNKPAWVPRPELVCSKCYKAGKVKLWLPWENPPGNYVSHFCDACYNSWRDVGAMLAISNTGAGNQVPISTDSISNSKEDKMFQVTTYNFATGVVTNASYAKLCEAEQALERLVAGYRSLGVSAARVFFTASILDVRTGKYHGFVSEPPPKVELKTE